MRLLLLLSLNFFFKKLFFFKTFCICNIIYKDTFNIILIQLDKKNNEDRFLF